MTIATVDQALAGMQPTRYFYKAITPTLVAGRPQSLWGIGGIPGAGAFDTTLNGVTLSSTSALVNGQLPFYDGGANTYLARFLATGTLGAKLLLCDRLWHNGGFTITSTSAQTIVSPTWPARDEAGATAGKSVLLGMEVSAATGAGVPTITASYTNNAGTAGRSATNAIATLATSAAGAFYPIGLQSGDVGVKSVESITLSATWTSGTMNLVAYRVLAGLDIPAPYIPAAIDILTGGMPQLFNGTVPFFLIVPSSSTAQLVSGAITYMQG